MTAIPLNEAGIRTAKRALQAFFSDTKSAPLTEALASACGFNSQAALLAKLKTTDPVDPDYVLLDEAAFSERLTALDRQPHSFGSFDDLKYADAKAVIYTDSSQFDLVDYSKSVRKRAWRNSMVAAINEGLDRRLFSVRPGDNRWPGFKSDPRERSETYSYHFEIDDIPAVASVHDAGYDELSIHVALWPAAEGQRWVKASNAGFHAGEVFASGWLERREGAWLQVSSGSPTGNSFACRKDRLPTVAAISVRPKGFADRGNFKL